MTPVSQAANGVCYATAGENSVGAVDLERMIAAVPGKAAGTLKRKAYYFVPLTVSQGEEVVIADRYDVALSDNAVCHRNLNLGDSQCVFISTRLMDDKFSVAFEFYINVGHALVEAAGVSHEFSELAWKQVEALLLPKEEMAGGRPITPLHAGHVGLLCTAGLLNGVFGQGDERHIARWRSVKSVTVFEVKEKGYTEVHKREQFTNELALVYEDGRTLVLGDKKREDQDAERTFADGAA